MVSLMTSNDLVILKILSSSFAMSEFAVHFSAFVSFLVPPTGNSSSRFVLSLQHPSDRLMGARDPQQAQKANNRNLANDRKAVDYEGDTPAPQGCLDQIGHSHRAVSQGPVNWL